MAGRNHIVSWLFASIGLFFFAEFVREVRGAVAPACDNECRQRIAFRACPNGNWVLFSKPDCTFCTTAAGQNWTGWCKPAFDPGGTCQPNGLVKMALVGILVQNCPCVGGVDFVEAIGSDPLPEDYGSWYTWYVCMPAGGSPL